MVRLVIHLLKENNMYDINVFLENRRYIVSAIEKLEFNLECVGDHAHESFEFEIDMGNVSLVVNATIMETFVAIAERHATSQQTIYLNAI